MRNCIFVFLTFTFARASQCRVNNMSVRVVARIRPLLKQELDKDTIVTAETLEGESAPTVIRLPSPKNDAESFSFQFSSVYEQEATQQQLFDAESA